MNDYKKMAIRLGLLVLIGSLIGFGPAAISVTEKTQKAQSAFEAGDFQKQSEILVSLAEENPWWKPLWESAGDAAFRAGDYQLAKTCYERAAQRNFISEKGRNKLGESYLQIGDSQAAEAVWQDLEESPDALEHLALVYEEQGKISQAVETWQTYLTLSDQGATPEVILHFGLLMAADSPPQALVFLDEAAGQYPQAAEISADIKNSLTEEPAYQYVTAGQSLAALNQWSLAAYAFQKAASLRPDYLEAYAYWGEALQHQENPSADPLEILEKAYALDNQSPLVNLFLGLYWQRTGSHAKALEFFQAAELVWPDHPEIYVEQGRSNAALGDLEKALENYQKSTEIAPLEGIYYRQLAEFCVSYSYQVKEIGLPAARIAVQLNDQDPANLDELGQVLLALEDDLNALRLFQRALDVDPGYAPALFHLGIIYSNQGNQDLAVYYLEQVLANSENLALRDQAERLLTNYLP